MSRNFDTRLAIAAVRFLDRFPALRLGALAGVFFVSAAAQTLAPGGPGADAQWPSAGKQAVGTSASADSKIWFTLQGGMLTEVFYPRVDTANVNQLQFVVVDRVTKKVETERDDAVHEITPLRPDALSFRQTNTAKSNQWTIVKTYAVDPERSTLLIDVELRPKTPDRYDFYLYYDPSINNSGMRDTAALDGGLIAFEGDIFSALIGDHEFGGDAAAGRAPVTNGFFGVSDGLTELRKNPAGGFTGYQRAENGNVVQFAPVALRPGVDRIFHRETFYLGFGRTRDEALVNAQNSRVKGFVKCRDEYERGWAQYVRTLPAVEPQYRAQFNMAAMVLRAFEDKTFLGGSVASLSTPWGGGVNGNETTTGYHLVWSRDLYQVATAFIALGDRAAAARALEYLFNYQQRGDGSFPQISWLDGRPVGDSVQMDEVSYPLILAYQLGRTDRATFDNHVRKSAEYIVKNGPRTKQERWEEEAGFSPSTIAAEIAALVCAAEIARINNDLPTAKRWLAYADNWQRNVENWTATKTGKYGDGNYYLRLSQNGRPDSGERLALGNGAGTHDEREIVDAGFLELVRLGVKPADDPLIAKSVRVVDQVIRAGTPHGDVFYRYNRDGYGDTYDGRRWNWDATWRGNGHPWPLLAGERGEYELALAAAGGRTPDRRLVARARSRLDAMLGFANEGLMIPEQIWEKPSIPKTIDAGFIPPLKFGEGNGSATPLAWSMAQFIRLALNLKAGRNLETPDVVAKRYGKK